VRQAATQTDQKLKQNFLDKERRWLMLAQSYDFTQRLGDLSDEANRRADNLYGEHQSVRSCGVRRSIPKPLKPSQTL